VPKHLCDDRARWRPVRRPMFPPACARTSSNSHPVTNHPRFPPNSPFPGLRRGTRPRKLLEQTPGQVEVCTASVTRLPRTVLTVPLTAARRLREVGARHYCRCRQVAIQRPGWGLCHTRRLRTDPHLGGSQAVGQGPAGQYQCVYRIQLSMQ